MPTIKHIFPVFPVSNLTAAIEHYRGLGFQVVPYKKGGYAFAVRDGAEIHLAAVTGKINQTTTTSAAYLEVNNADELAREWAETKVAGHLTTPVSTEYGMREGAHVDPDGNLLRFGSKLG